MADGEALEIMMKKNKVQFAILIVIFISLLFFLANSIIWWWKEEHLQQLGPKDIVRVYLHASQTGDEKLLKKIISNNELLEKRIRYGAEAFAESVVMKLTLSSRKPTHVTYHGSNIAKVEVVSSSLIIPDFGGKYCDISLVKNNNQWKIESEDFGKPQTRTLPVTSGRSR